MKQPKQIANYLTSNVIPLVYKIGLVYRITDYRKDLFKSADFARLIINTVREGKYNFPRCVANFVQSDHENKVSYCLLGGLCHVMNVSFDYDALYAIGKRLHNHVPYLHSIWSINNMISPKEQDWDKVVDLLEFVAFSTTTQFNKMISYLDTEKN